MGLIALGIGGAVIGGAAAGSKGTGKNKIERLTKNPALEKYNLGLQGDYGALKGDSQKALDQYIRDFLAGGKTATARSGQEQQVIDRYYNGDVERELANLRTRRADAGNTALQRALAYATHSQNLDQLTRSGTGSSYDRQQALRTGGDLTLQNLLANLGQERSDLDYLHGNQLNLMGRRTASADALALRDLIPTQASQANFGWNTSALNSLLGLDQSNNMYGVKYEPSGFEKVMNVVGGAWDGFLGAGAGGIGGAKPTGGTGTPTSGGTTWGAGSSGYFPMQSVGAAAYGSPSMYGAAAPTFANYNPPAYNPVPTLGTGSMWGGMF